MPRVETVDIEPEEFERRVEAMAGAENPASWFASQTGRSASWVRMLFRGDQPVPVYAMRTLEALERARDLRDREELLPAARRKRAAEFAGELREIRLALKRHLGGYWRRWSGARRRCGG